MAYGYGQQITQGIFTIDSQRRGISAATPLPRLPRMAYGAIASDIDNSAIYIGRGRGGGTAISLPASATGDLTRGGHMEVLSVVGLAGSALAAIDERAPAGRSYISRWLPIDEPFATPAQPDLPALAVQAEPLGATGPREDNLLSWQGGRLLILTASTQPTSRGQLWELTGNRLRLIEALPADGPRLPAHISLLPSGEVLMAEATAPATLWRRSPQGQWQALLRSDNSGIGGLFMQGNQLFLNIDTTGLPPATRSHPLGCFRRKEGRESPLGLLADRYCLYLAARLNLLWKRSTRPAVSTKRFSPVYAG
jgi:hypothetical protein